MFKEEHGREPTMDEIKETLRTIQVLLCCLHAFTPTINPILTLCLPSTRPWPSASTLTLAASGPTSSFPVPVPSERGMPSLS